MTQPRPTAVGYVSAPDDAERDRQRDALTGYAKAEGLHLAGTFTDPRNGWTISQLLEVVDDLEATCVLIPSGVHLAQASARVSADLANRSARCVVVDAASTSTEPDVTRPAARLPTGLRRREPLDAAAEV
jgi:hypothetical protein